MYSTAAEALGAAQESLAEANRLILQAGALPSSNIRREIDHLLLTYQRAMGAHSRLTHREDRKREHSARVQGQPTMDSTDPGRRPGW